jgi:hypothetical protein
MTGEERKRSNGAWDRFMFRSEKYVEWSGVIESVSLAVPCPYCPAQHGQSCQSKNNTPAATHAGRWYRARDVLTGEW